MRLEWLAALVWSSAALCATPDRVTASFLGSLPVDASPRAVAVDSSGNILVAGFIGKTSVGVYSSDGFLAKYAPDQQTQLSYLLLPNGSFTALANDASGNAYAAGTSGTSVVLLKLDHDGNEIYRLLLGESDGFHEPPAAIAVNRAGEVFVTGGGLSGNGFLARVAASGDHLIYVTRAAGGTGLAVDAENNAYVVTGTYDSTRVPVTENAIQKTVPFTVCGGNRAFVFPCSHQNVTKIDPTGTRILFCTFVSGSYGESQSSIAVDARGDIYLAGVTNSTDYPVSANALQPQNRVSIPPPPVFHEFFFQGLYVAFPSTAYITKLAGDGSRVIYSTYLGGTRSDTAFGIGVDDQGQASVWMRLQSPDFPALPKLPQRCLPDRLHGVPVLVRLNSAGDAIRSATVVEGIAPGLTTIGTFDDPGSSLITSERPFLARVTEDAVSPPDPLICMTDQTDFVQPSAIAPGQLLTLFGTGLNGASVSMNGVAAETIFSSEEQINFIAPYEIAAQPAASLEVITTAGVHARRTLPAARSNPSLMTLGQTDYPACQGQTVENSVAAVVRNADGSQNSCDNPAAMGSTVSLYLAGTGAANPPSLIQDGFGNQVLRILPAEWAPAGLWRVEMQVKVPNTWLVLTTLATAISLNVDGVGVREAPVAVWLR